MRKRYSQETREEVLGKIRGGQKVAEVSKAHGISEMTVRTWLERDTNSPAAETLELSRLRWENEALFRIIGQLALEAEIQKKNQRRARR